MVGQLPFEFNDASTYADSDAVYVAHIPTGLSNTEELFNALRDALNLPEYFGYNWNALSDVLRDLHWLNQRTVVLVHEDLPNIPESDLTNYLEVLAEAVTSWRAEEEHSVRVVFPDRVRPDVLRSLRIPR